MKNIKLDNKIYKEVLVVNLTTEKAKENSLIYSKVSNKFVIAHRELHGNKIFEVPNHGKENHELLPQYLYFLSDEDIKPGDKVLLDWCGEMKEEDIRIGTCLEFDEVTNVMSMKNQYGNISKTSYNYPNDKKYKIIASDDPSLGLPIPSYDFYKHFCEIGGTKKVLVEYEIIPDNSEYSLDYILQNNFDVNFNLKVSAKNIVITKFIKQDNFNRNEVINLIKKACNECGAYMTPEQWVEENL